MKSFGIKILLSLFLVFGFHNQINAQGTLPSNTNKTISELNQYLKTVNLDEGKVLNKKMLDDFIQTATNDNWYNQVKFWVSSQWGIKESKGAIVKQYDLAGNEMKTNYMDKRTKKITEGDHFGVQYDGIDDYSDFPDFKASQPVSVMLVFKADPNADVNVLFDSKGGRENKVSVQKNDKGELELVIVSGGEIKLSGIKDGINIVYIEYNLKDSKVFINGNLAYQNVIGKSDMNGIVLGQGKVNGKDYNFKGVLYETGVINKILKDDERDNLLNFEKEVYHLN